MKTCETYQAQMLEQVYGLLDAEESQALAGHAAQCDACRAAQARAPQQQRLLAAAAKAQFAGVRFQTPSADTLPLTGRAKSGRSVPARPSWTRWAVAAVVVLALGTLGVPAAVRLSGFVHQKRLVAVHNAKKNQLDTEISQKSATATADIAQLAKQIEASESTRVKEVEKLAAQNQEVNVQVVGPATYQAGGRNLYTFNVQNRNNQPAAAKLSVKVKDKAHNDAEIYAAPEIKVQNGSYQIALPPDLPMKPDADLYLEVLAMRDGAPAPPVHLSNKLGLAAPVYVTHLATDKPMYKPGETVFFRSLTLERFSLKPAQEELFLQYTLTNPQGAVVFQKNGRSQLINPQSQESALVRGPDGNPVHGIGAGELVLDPPDKYPGGQYTLTVAELNQRFPEQKRTFLVNQYERPQLNKELEFTKKSYGPGEEVVAACKVARVEGGRTVAGEKVLAAVRVDGRDYDLKGQPAGPQPKEAGMTDANGLVNVKFKLPAQMERGDASLSVQFLAGQVVETMVRSIPVVVKKLRVEFFPEGGDLVPGVPNRVYFQVSTPLDRPAELKGRIVDGLGKQVTEVQTWNEIEVPELNQGRGVFDILPQAGQNYFLKIDAPAGIEGEFKLPEIKLQRVALRVANGVSTDQDPIRVVVHSADKDRDLLVNAYCRGRLMATHSLHAKQGEGVDIQLKPESGVGGVYRVTVFEQQGKNGPAHQLQAVAERLIYRMPAAKLDLAVTADKQQYVPGDKVNLTVKAQTEKGQPAPAVLLVAVVDKSVVKLADEKTARGMPTHFYLTTEVRRPEDLEHADFLLRGDAKAFTALDLLLGTQGWRRFAEIHPDQFQQRNQTDPKQAEDAQRLFMVSGQLAKPVSNFAERALLQLEEKALAEQTDLHARLEKSQEDWAKENKQLQEERRATDRSYLAAVSAMESYRVPPDQVRTIGLSLGAVFLVVALLCFAVALMRTATRAVPFYATSVCSLLLCGVVLMGMMFVTEGRDTMRVAQGPAAMTAPKSGPAPDMADMAPRERLEERADKPRNAAPEAAAQPMLLKADAQQNDAKKALPPQAKAPPAPGMALGGGNMMRAAKPGMAQAVQVQGQAQAQAMPMAPGGPRGAANQKGEAKAQMPMAQDKAGNLQNLQELKKAPQGMFGANRDGAPRKEMERGDADRLAAGPAANRALVNGVEQARRQLAQKKREMAKGQEEKQAAGGKAFEGRAKDLRMRMDEEALEPQPALEPLMVREYAHQHIQAKDNVRADFAETIYWHPVLVTLANGKAQVSFELCDSVTSFEVLAFGHTLDGRLGAAKATVEARKPFKVEPKLPIEVTAGDQIIVPLTLDNSTDSQRSIQVEVQPQDLTLLEGKSNEILELNAQQNVRRFFKVQPSIQEGEARLRFIGTCVPFDKDSIERTLKVVPAGFPVVGSQSDVLEKVAEAKLTLPPDWVKGTLHCQVNVFPSTLASLQKGLEGLLREPGGCFEQTSTSNYPNLLILDYLKTSDQSKPETERRALALLDRGYAMLTSFECQNPSRQNREGYEWFGGTAPPHEALTAYGLMQFRDMARVYKVDENMVERTSKYLLSRRDGQGGFQRNQRAIDTFGRAPDDITNAYIIWALTESGEKEDLSKEIAKLNEQAKTSNDSYFLALVANALLNRNKGDKEGFALLKKLAAAQKDDGHLDATRTSITGSGGRDLQIETTALTILGWLKADQAGEFRTNLKKSVDWIGKQRGGYGAFGSTQSTILALKSLIAYANANKKPLEDGNLQLLVGDKTLAELDFKANQDEALVLKLPDAEKHLQPGANVVTIKCSSAKNIFPYTLAWSYQTLKPDSVANYPVQVTTKLSRDKASEGEAVQLDVTVENKSGKGQGMTVAIVGLPAGLTLPEDLKQLKDLARLRNDGKDAGLISAFETRGRELILYWRDLGPTQKIEVSLDLICRVPGEYKGPASRAYLYYNADVKHWVEPLTMSITPKGN